jgi:glycerate 2-kinase
VVGGVVALGAELGVPVLIVAGEVLEDAPARAPAISLVERFGREAALGDAGRCLEAAIAERLSPSS